MPSFVTFATAIIRFQFRNWLYTHDVLYVISCFRPFTYTFFFTIIRSDYSLPSELESFFSKAHSRGEYRPICAKFHSNPATKYGDIASRGIVLMLTDNGHLLDRRTDRQPENIMLSDHFSWRKHNGRGLCPHSFVWPNHRGQQCPAKHILRTTTTRYSRH